MTRVHELTLLPNGLAVARLRPGSGMPWWAAESAPLLAFVRTPDETSVICDEACVPADVQSVRGYRALRVTGPLAFSEVGVLSALSVPLALEGVPILVVSTWETDYLLVPGSRLDVAVAALRSAGHTVTG